MNVFHKVLIRIFEISGGKDSFDVDLVDLLKKEGFYSNIDSISRQLQDEGWVTESGRKNVVRITHWGTTEAKRVLSASPDKANEVEKNSNKLLNEAKELIIMLEEFAVKPESKKLDLIDKRLSDLRERSGTIRTHL
jgi:hypothetical protein